MVISNFVTIYVGKLGTGKTFIRMPYFVTSVYPFVKRERNIESSAPPKVSVLLIKSSLNNEVLGECAMIQVYQ